MLMDVDLGRQGEEGEHGSVWCNLSPLAGFIRMRAVLVVGFDATICAEFMRPTMLHE